MKTKFVCPECNESFQIEDVEFKCSKHKYATMESTLFDFILGNTPRYCPECNKEADFISHNSKFDCKGCSSDIINPDKIKKSICIISQNNELKNNFREKIISEISSKFADVRIDESDKENSPKPEYISLKHKNKQFLMSFYFVPAEKNELLQTESDEIQVWKKYISNSEYVFFLAEKESLDDIILQVATDINEDKDENKNIDILPTFVYVNMDNSKNETINKSLLEGDFRERFFSSLDIYKIVNWLIEEK